MGWDLLVKFLLELGIEAGPSFGRLAGQALSQLLDDIRSATYSPDVVEYSFRLAAGVMATNPTMRVAMQFELIEEGIRLLMLNPNVKRAPTPLSVKALTALSLVRAGFPVEDAPAAPDTPA